jgi:hypothetical protein
LERRRFVCRGAVFGARIRSSSITSTRAPLFFSWRASGFFGAAALANAAAASDQALPEDHSRISNNCASVAGDIP